MSPRIKTLEIRLEESHEESVVIPLCLETVSRAPCLSELSLSSEWEFEPTNVKFIKGLRLASQALVDLPHTLTTFNTAYFEVDIKTRNFITALSCLPNLEDLDLGSQTCVIQPKITSPIGCFESVETKRFPSLKYLKFLSSCPAAVTFIRQHFHDDHPLKSWNAMIRGQITSDLATTIIRKFPRLRILQLMGNRSSDDHFFDATFLFLLAPLFDGLTELRLTPIHIPTKELQEISVSWTRLTELELVGKSFTHYLREHGTKLPEADLSSSGLLEVTALETLAANCPSLEILEISVATSSVTLSLPTSQFRALRCLSLYWSFLNWKSRLFDKFETAKYIGRLLKANVNVVMDDTYCEEFQIILEDEEPELYSLYVDGGDLRRPFAKEFPRLIKFASELLAEAKGSPFADERLP